MIGLIVSIGIYTITQFFILDSALSVTVSIIPIFLMSISLGATYYTYDFSGLYNLNWFPDLKNNTHLNIHAGFDETSEIIKQKNIHTQLTIADFYDPKKHTEISIKRARRKYPPIENTLKVEPTNLGFDSNTFDSASVIFAAHEIRDKEERVNTFLEIKRILKPGSDLIIVEHLRDLSNLLVYNIGAFHFYSKSDWIDTFSKSGFELKKSHRVNPFVTTFILKSS